MKRAFVALAALVTLAACVPPPGASVGGAAAPVRPPALAPLTAEAAVAALRHRLARTFPDLVVGNVAPDAGMHLGDVTDADVDRTGTFVVSGSNDKTARVRRLDDGRPVHVLRIPGSGEEGQINAVAMSPDGAVIAVGGWEGTIYLFRTSDWRLVGAIPKLATITAMRFSPDGRRLAVGLWGQGGVRVFETDGYRPVFTDRSYDRDCYGLAFSKSGVLAVASWDGTVRLYGPDHALLAKQRFEQRPHRLAFDPREEMVVVGFVDRPIVRLLSVPKLDVVRELSITPRDPTDTLGSVAWAANGTEIYASGRYDYPDGHNPILRWRRDGTRLPDWVLQTNTPDQLVALADGGLLVAAQDPMFAALDASGAARWVLRPRTVDFTGQRPTLRFSADASTVQFTWRRHERERLTFNVRALRFVDGEPALRAPVTRAPGIDVANWESTGATLNGRKLAIEAPETCRALAIDAPHDWFLLGCEWNVYAFASSGRLIWKHGYGASVRGLSLSEDGRIAVVAIDDGTFRWLASNDGRLLLSLFFYERARDWVAWTPAGFFTGSEFGESLLGIHALRGDGSTELLPMLGFADLMRRPDLVARALDRPTP